MAEKWPLELQVNAPWLGAEQAAPAQVTDAGHG